MTGHSEPTRPARPNRPWTPCRRHLFDLLASVLPRARQNARWRIPASLWEAMKTDPCLNADWHDRPWPTLLGLPVDLVPDGCVTVQLTVTADCRPGR